MGHDLQQKWKLIERFLCNARSDLPAEKNPSPEFSALLAEFAEFMSHNELGLALESIAAAGELVETKGRFWHSLHLAANKMGLVEQAQEFESRFVQAATLSLQKTRN